MRHDAEFRYAVIYDANGIKIIQGIFPARCQAEVYANEMNDHDSHMQTTPNPQAPVERYKVVTVGPIKTVVIEEFRYDERECPQ